MDAGRHTEPAKMKTKTEEMKFMKKLLSALIAVVMLFSVSLAFAKTLEPEDTEIEHLAGKTVSATVGAYDEATKTFTVTVYDYDRYEKEDVAKLAVGDTILAGGWLYKITGTEDVDGEKYFKCEDGEEINFGKSYDAGDDHDEVIARSIMDSRIFMNVVTVLHLPAAEGIVYEDQSDPDLEAKPIIAEGLENILKAKAEKEQNSNGFNFYATKITLNENLEIVKIHQDYDVAQ